MKFCVHGSKSLIYMVVGPPIWATNAPLLCDSRSKLSRWLFDRCSSSIRVETDDLQLLLGCWPLIDRDSQQSHVHRFPRVCWSWFSACDHLACVQNREVGLKSRYVEISTLVSFCQIECRFHLPSAFDSLAFCNPFCRKEVRWKGSGKPEFTL